jgi:hypothetical protein
MSSLNITPGQLRQARNQLRGPMTKRQIIGTQFIGPLMRNERRARPARAKSMLTQTNPRRINAPVATASVFSGNTQSTAAPFILRRKEYVGDIAGSVALTVTKYSLNPGLQSTFFWAGGIAPSFEEYDSASVAFHYEPESSSSATGTIILAFDFDAADISPTTKQEMLTFSDNVRAAPWVPCTLVLKLSDLRKRGRLFVRNASVPNTDIKTYDLGSLYVGTSGQAGTANVGELWISYSFPLHTPTTNTQLLSQHITGATPTTASLMGTQTVVAGSSSLASIVGNVITFLIAGKYVVIYNSSSTTNTFTAPPAVSAGAVFLPTFVGDVSSPGYAQAGSATAASVQVCVLTTPVGGVLTFDDTFVNGVTAEILIVNLPVNQL